MGVLQQDLEHLRSVRDLDHLDDPHAGVQLLNLGLKLRFRVFPHKGLDLADKNSLPSEEIRGCEKGKVDLGQGLDGGGFK